MNRKELAKKLRDNLENTEIQLAEFSELDKVITEYFHNGGRYISSYERERIKEHLEAIKGSLWNLIGQFCNNSAYYINDCNIDKIED